MNTLEAIKTRRSTRKFKAQPVELEKLKQIVEAGQFISELSLIITRGRICADDEYAV